MSYNGWTNYQTWAVNLWLSDEGASNDIVEMSKQHDIPSLAQVLKDYVSDLMPELNGLAGDLLGHAIDSVNWYELAEAYHSDYGN